MDDTNKYEVLINHMLQLKLITEQEHLTLKSKKEKFEWPISTFPDSPILIPVIFSNLSKAILEDCECGRVPPDYEELISRIFKLIEEDTGKAKAKLIYTKKIGEADSYHLIITIEEDEFKIDLQDTGDYYNITNVQTILNQILAHKKLNYRFISLDTEDQAFCLYKGDMQKIIELYKIYDMEYFVDQ